MIRGLKAYLFAEETAYTDKRLLKGAKDEDFREITLYISDGTIMNLNDQINHELEDERDD